MSRASTGRDVQAFGGDLERELRDRRLTLPDSEILSTLESKEGTREQICEWAKAIYAATRHGRTTMGTEQPDGLERLREKTLAFAPVAKDVCNGHGVRKRS